MHILKQFPEIKELPILKWEKPTIELDDSTQFVMRPIITTIKWSDKNVIFFTNKKNTV